MLLFHWKHFLQMYWQIYQSPTQLPTCIKRYVMKYIRLRKKYQWLTLLMDLKIKTWRRPCNFANLPWHGQPAASIHVCFRNTFKTSLLLGNDGEFEATQKCQEKVYFNFKQYIEQNNMHAIKICISKQKRPLRVKRFDMMNRSDNKICLDIVMKYSKCSWIKSKVSF